MGTEKFWAVSYSKKRERARCQTLGAGAENEIKPRSERKRSRGVAGGTRIRAAYERSELAALICMGIAKRFIVGDGSHPSCNERGKIPEGHYALGAPRGIAKGAEPRLRTNKILLQSISEEERRGGATFAKKKDSE